MRRWLHRALVLALLALCAPALSASIRTILWTDAFTRADNVDLGAQYDSGYTSTTALQIVSNALRASSTSGDSLESYNGSGFGADMWASIAFKTWSGSSGEIGVETRFSAPANWNAYAFVVDTTATNILLITAPPFAATTLATRSDITWGAGDVLLGISLGTTHRLYRQASGSSAWTLLLTGTDATLTSGRPGLQIASGAALGNTEADDFAAGNVRNGNMTLTGVGLLFFVRPWSVAR